MIGKMPEVVTVGSRPLGKSQMIEPRLAGVAAFPQDLRAEHGFDNQADHLSLSPLLMEAFLQLGQSITQSKDFGPRTVGIWDSFFLAPQQNAQGPRAQKHGPPTPRSPAPKVRALPGRRRRARSDSYAREKRGNQVFYSITDKIVFPLHYFKKLWTKRSRI